MTFVERAGDNGHVAVTGIGKRSRGPLGKCRIAFQRDDRSGKPGQTADE